MLISVTAARLHLSPTLRALIPVVRKRTFYAFSLLCLAFRMEKFFQGLFFNFFFLDSPPPGPLLCRLPGFRCVKACIIFHQLSVLISTKAAAMEQPLRLFVGLNFTDVRLLSFPRLNAAQQGWICKTNAAVCVRGSQVAQKGRFSKRREWRKSALCARQINQKQKRT